MTAFISTIRTLRTLKTFNLRRLATAVILSSVLVLQIGCASSNNSAASRSPADAAAGASSPVAPNATPSNPAAPTKTADATVPPSEPSIPAEKFDVVLVGSELEGIYLARTAADAGLSVKVIDPREQPGGQLLQGEMLFLDAVLDKMGKGKLIAQGSMKELMTGFRSGKIRKLSEFTDYYQQLADGIPIESGIRIQDIAQQPGLNGEPLIASVTYETPDGTIHRLEADYWVENTDFGALADKLGASAQPGAGAYFGSTSVEYMGAGMMMKFKNVDWRKFQNHGYATVNESYGVGVVSVTQKYTPSSDRVLLRGLNAVNQRDGEVLINALLVYQVDPSSDESVTDAVDIGKKETDLILQHFRKNMAGWENAELNGYPNYLYIREFNHYEADYMLQVSDMLGGRMFYDNVSIAGYPLDLQGVMHVKWGTEIGRPDKYGMPLRSFLLRGYENVILAGKNVGASAIAYGSARIQQNTSIAAEAIGAVIGHLQGTGKKLKELQPEDWPELHRYLESARDLKLTGVQAINRIADWTPEEIGKLNIGQINYTIFERTGKK